MPIDKLIHLTSPEDRFDLNAIFIPDEMVVSMNTACINSSLDLIAFRNRQESSKSIKHYKENNNKKDFQFDNQIDYSMNFNRVPHKFVDIE